MMVAPSILAADMLNMERDVQRMIDAGKIQQDRQRYILKKETIKEA